jgi:vacuolar-type H+-ATPase subunit I/STV1
MSLEVRKMCLKLAFALDPDMTGKMPIGAMKHVWDEVADVVKNCNTADSRERELFMVVHGDEELASIERQERLAHRRSIALSDDDDDDERQDDEATTEDDISQDELDELEAMIASEEEIRAEEERSKMLQLTYVCSGDEEHDSTNTKKKRRRLRKKEAPDP